MHFQGKKERQPRKRHSLGDLENRRRSTDNIPLKKRDRVFEKVDIRDRKEKFVNLEKEAKKVRSTLFCFSDQFMVSSFLLTLF